MALSKTWTTVTPLSKTLALLLVIALPFIGFYFGTKYATPQLPPQLHAVLPTPTASSGDNGTKLCSSDSDCSSDQNCVTPGPVHVDPSLNKSYCYNKGTAIPL